ncbi:MAG TPA: bstEII [Blastocatellia bacterium]|nr:bstEII [Blastocatellia bacterium]HMV84956.1 bstEII [Blastocatellia bacterium]HMX29710.1 bstEII [Blastocatellia bacterium]HMY70658.1 bstEII [Blastocatellia bacterium]HMZ16874.1 bstEII [Blastocatellia bacterium]
MARKEKRFADYKAEGAAWITLATGEYYPDILPLACELYKPVLVMFGHLLQGAHSSVDLFMAISEVREQWMRIQLSRVFRKYVSPETPVEMLKKKSSAAKICEQFGSGFRNIVEVQKAFQSRPLPDEALCAILWEYKDRGKKGYDLTSRLFAIFREMLPEFILAGPERAGRDVLLGEVLQDYPKPNRPVDFVIFDGAQPVAVGLARYDSDRGGAQEDDRPGQYRDCAQEILTYAKKRKLNLKVIFVNDGPGLLLGSMWNDYAHLEAVWGNKVKVVTLRMVAERITASWLRM